jgi:hypothetical protein
MFLSERYQVIALRHVSFAFGCSMLRGRFALVLLINNPEHRIKWTFETFETNNLVTLPFETFETKETYLLKLLKPLILVTWLSLPCTRPLLPLTF